MALNILRGVRGHCQRSYQLLKQKRSYFVGSSCILKDEFPVRYGLLVHTAHAACEPPNIKHNSFSLLHKKKFSTCCVHFMSLRAIEDIDIEEIRKQVFEERNKSTDKNIHVTAKVKEIVAAKCNEIMANLGPEDEKKLKVLQLEHSFMYSEGFMIPSTEEMCSENWLEAMKLSSKNQRLKYYAYLARLKFVKESAKSKEAAKKAQESEERLKTEIYEHGRMFMRIYETTMKRWQNYRLAQSMMFGIPLVLDMDYTEHMRRQELKNTAKQLHDLYILNRNDDSPFHLHFTSCAQDNTMFRMLQLLQQEEQDFLATVSENSFLDLFNKQNLVYLSPNGRHVMKEFDPTAVYIIGAFNDKATMKPISYARAKEYNIKCQRLPLDERLQWNQGSKSLTLDQMIKILIALKNKKSWLEAFSVIPKRKLRNQDGQ